MTQEHAEEVLMYHKFLYYEKGDPILTDYQYDELAQNLRKDFPESNLINNIIECPKQFWPAFEGRYARYKKFQAQIKQDRLSEPTYGFMNPIKPLESVKDKIKIYLKKIS